MSCRSVARSAVRFTARHVMLYVECYVAYYMGITCSLRTHYAMRPALCQAWGSQAFAFLPHAQ